ncbi:MAG: hypothetical protein ACI8PZ_006599 [Myxococcota bacterium]|jgi:hypothetical protein
MRITTALPLLGLLACGFADNPDDEWGPEASSLGWAHTAAGPLAPPIADLVLRSGAAAGAPVQLEVVGGPPGVRATLLVSTIGVGDGPCHPAYPDDLCLDILSPRSVSSTLTALDGSARFAVRLPAHAPTAVVFQVALLDPDAPGVSTALAVDVARFSVDWPVADRLEVTIDGGESAYEFGMAETDAGPFGWYGEDCFAGTPPYFHCHQVDDSGMLDLDSVHPDLGGPGVEFVAEDATTLFYDIHHPAITYYFRGLDSGDCWTFGATPAYYVDAFGCAVL